mmetsp:Transcript_12542/g.41043  ORF Transcript_12542/g.41043 Transcript_12542/m.41043 type:complete len:178 (+) Transcript_12542:58-591(+)
MASAEILEAAVRSVFSRWTLLRLAVDQGWSDGDGAANANALLASLLALLLRDKKVFVDEVEDLLFDALEGKFNALAEDGSVEEVATLLLKLRAECAAGNFATAQDIISKAAAQGQQGAAPSASIDQTADDVSDDDLNDDSDEEMVGVSALSRREEPVVDEDGFQVVASQRKGRSRRG